MGEATRRNHLGLNKVGSMAYSKQDSSMSNVKCEMCGGKTCEEHNENFYQDGIESYDLLQCFDCGFEKKFNNKWEGYKS